MVHSIHNHGSHIPFASEHLDANRYHGRYVLEYICSWSAVLTLVETGHPLVPLHQLIFAVQTAVTTLVCMVEVFSFAYTRMEEIKLSALYSTYLLLAVVMGIDSFSRLRNVIDSRPKVKSV